MAHPSDPHSYHPGELRVSKLRFYSIGVVAENKALSSNIIEVTPLEELPMLDGEISANTTTHTASGVDANGKAYTSSVTMGNSIQAEWLRLGSSNRMTAPDVRRGETIVIYQFGDADKYYWNTLKNDSALRRLETVVYAFSGTPDNAEAGLNASNSYYFEVSTHTKLVTFHTSQANGEPFSYDIQINTGEGYILIQDNIGNVFTLDSRAHQLRMQNTEGSYVDLTKQVLSMFTGDQINMITKKYSLKASESSTVETVTSTLNATDTTIHSTNTTIQASNTHITSANVDVSGSDISIVGGASLDLNSPGLTFS
jgi:hypothetical protein